MARRGMCGCSPLMVAWAKAAPHPAVHIVAQGEYRMSLSQYIIFYAIRLACWGLVFQALWAWFIAPTLHLPLLTWNAIMGINAGIILVTSPYLSQAEKDAMPHYDPHFIDRIIYLILVSAVCYVLGYVTHRLSP